ncbi:FG-GAP repeat domain-containing protein [Longispora albida]|uniref:FG-GAP repeat domain-containing protein n=1 Tax=Longispora albida TaxID=203523 RepID=UPI0009FCE5C2|nr:VCBS repeat-containing protein [Longispora albida]
MKAIRSVVAATLLAAVLVPSAAHAAPADGLATFSELSLNQVETPDRLTFTASARYSVPQGGVKLLATFDWGDGETTTTSVYLPALVSGKANEGVVQASAHRYEAPGEIMVTASFVVDGSGPYAATPLERYVPTARAVSPSQVADNSDVRADFNGDGYDDVVTSGFDLRMGKEGGLAEPVTAWDPHFSWSPGMKHFTAGDYNGDGRAELGILRDENLGYVGFYTLTFNTATGTFDKPKLQWEAPQWGSGTKFVSSGDFDGDGRSDLALFYQYDSTHIGVFKAIAKGDGSFHGLLWMWDAPLWGGGTKSVSAGDYDGDGKAELALFYHYGGSHVAVFTLDGQGRLNQRWNAPYWGGGTKFVQTGNFAGAKNSDLALFYDYGNGHVTTFSLGDGPAGPLSSLGTIWDAPVWSKGTEQMAAGRYSAKAGRDDLVLLHADQKDMVSVDWRMLMISPDAASGYRDPKTVWQAAKWHWISAMF